MNKNNIEHFWQQIIIKLGNKVDKVDGKGLSTEDYTTDEKTKLAGIAANANNYTHPTTSGNKHIPSGGSSGQILRWSADGTAAWGTDNNTDTKVTSVGNHYTPSGGTTTSASGGTLTDITNSSSGVQVVTGVTKDAAGHVTGVTSAALKSTDTNTDTKVTQTVTSSNAAYPLLLAPSGQTANTTTTSYFDSGVTLNPSTNTIAANISGNATTATSATKATQDSDGNQINTTYVKKSGSVMANLNALTATTSTTENIIPNDSAIASSPFARDLWHDHFAFLAGGHKIQNHQVSTDGSTWTEDSLDLTDLFIQKDKVDVLILNTEQLSRRFTLYTDQLYCSMISWYEIGVSYTDPFSNFEVHIETSRDGVNWSDVHKSTITTCQHPFFLKGTSLTNSYYVRFTFTKTTSITTGTVELSCIKAYTMRKSDQGLGIEYEYPYNWNKNRDIYPHTDNLRSLGLSNARWKNVYATTFNGNLSGTATYLKVNYGSEINFKGLSSVDNVHFNYRNADTNTSASENLITKYYFDNKAGNTTGVTLYAENFSGNAATATKATQDSAGQQINTTYIKGLSVSGKTVTYTKGDDSTGTFTTQDTTNTAGSTDTSSKIYLVGATSQAASPQTYSDNQVYVTNGQLDANKVRIAEKATMQYDATNECINFVFA